MPPVWKTIKIPAGAYDDAVALRDTLARVGLDALPPRLRKVAVDDRAGAGRGLGIGTVVALGLLALEDVIPKRVPRNRRR